MHVPIGEAISFLKLLFDVYVYKKKAGKSEKADPDPEKVQEVIEKLELKLEDRIPEPTDSVSTQIEETLAPDQAETLKNDLALLEFLANPPSADEYDYWGMLTDYAKGIQAIAIRSKLFLSRGFKNEEGKRILELPKTSVALVPKSAVQSAIVPDSSGLRASVTEVKVLLIDEANNMPLIVAVMASFDRSSYGFGDVPPERDATLYRVNVGQEANWLQFEDLERHLRFENFTYRLTASDLQAIVGAMKADVYGYIEEAKKDREAVKSVREEIKSLIHRLGK